MRHAGIAVLAVVGIAACSNEPSLPIGSGTYRFEHRHAEHPTMPSVELKAIVDGRHMRFVNEQESSVFPKDIIAEGELAWHKASRQWILAQDAADRDAAEVGGCSDGPEVVDLVERIYWTC